MNRKNIVIIGIVLSLFLAIVFYIFSLENTQKIYAVVVPHHNLVAPERKKLFEELVTKIEQPETIILISPNHYSAGRGKIQTTNQDWGIQNGKILADKNTINYLVESKAAQLELGSFAFEHGIYNLFEDVHNFFPQAKLVPIILEDASLQQIEILNKELLQTCKNCLMIASVDFSHYQPALLSELHDELTLRDLNTLNTKDLLNNAEVDSGSSLALLTMWAKAHDTNKFYFQNRTSASVIAGNLDAEDTSHIFGWYEAGKPVNPEQSLSFIVSGNVDIPNASLNENIFDQLGNRVFWGTDVSVLNLTSSDFQTHTLNSIIEYLKVNFVSVNQQSQSEPQVSYYKYEELELAVVTGNASLNFAEQIKKIKSETKARILLIPQWSPIDESEGTWQNFQHTEQQARLARGWASIGADLIIGRNSGTSNLIQDMEIYQNVPIFYSVGSLSAVTNSAEVGLLVAGKFAKDSLEIFALPTQQENGKPKLLIGEEKKSILEKLYQKNFGHKLIIHYN